MTNRRDFLKKASMLVASGVVGSSILSSCGGGAAVAQAPKKHIGLQLYSLREDVRDLTIREVLNIVSQMGYVNLETADYNNGMFYGMAPAEFKKIVEDLGMQASSSHLMRFMSGNNDEDMAWWSRAAEAHAAAGMKYMVMPYAPFEGENANFDNVKRYCDYFNGIGMITAASSISFGYHNHAFEFNNMIDDKTVWEVLLENTSPRHVMFQNDVYWTLVGGYDPVEILKRDAQRIRLLHIKDEKAIGGSGRMDFKGIFEQAYANGVRDWYVEVEEYYGTPQEDVLQSFKFLNEADFVQ